MRVGIRPPKSICMALTVLLAIGLTAPVSAQPGAPGSAPPQAPAKDKIVVFDLEAADTIKDEALAVSDKLREELFKSGKYTLVDRRTLEAALKEQALQQAGTCTTPECAVKVGKVTGARKMVTGRLTKIDERRWLLSANIIDVETSETLRSESLAYEGTYFSLLLSGAETLVARLTGEQAAARAPAVPPAPPPAPAPPAIVTAPPVAAAAAQPEEKKGMSGWVWVLIGVLVIGAAVAASSSTTKKDTTSTTSTSPSSCANGCGTVTATW